MANIENLKPLTTEKAREIGSIGGKKSGEVKRARKTLKEELLLLLEQDGNQSNMTVSLIKKALDGDIKAFEVIRDTVGEKPTDKQEVEATINVKYEEILKDIK